MALIRRQKTMKLEIWALIVANLVALAMTVMNTIMMHQNTEQMDLLNKYTKELVKLGDIINNRKQ